MLIEKYIERPRHIEVQVFGDTHGNVVHLFERDCSLQRRHQKVIEEAPAPGVDWAFRSVICDAAVKAAKAIDYVGAGTIEFIADASEGLRGDRVWFMEMNTRLQVEHPVTEEITGQDLVEWQLRVASGEALPKKQGELSIDGWAIEARLYAEDPATGFLPSTGRLDHFQLEDGQARIDTGVEEGDVISPHYDPMIAKIIVHGEDRAAAAVGLAGVLDEIEVWPVKTNAAFLAEAVTHKEFWSGDVDTGFIPRHIDMLVPPAEPDDGIWQLAAAAMAGTARNEDGEDDPWTEMEGFRLNAPDDLRVALAYRGETRVIDRGSGAAMAAGSATRSDKLVVFYQGQAWGFDWPGQGGTGAGAVGGDGAIISPMPGKVIGVDVAQGERVAKGQKLLTLEAMKMEHSLAAPFDGIVTELNASEGAQVSEGALLARIEKGD